MRSFKRSILSILFFSTTLFISSCNSSRKATNKQEENKISQIKLIGEYVVPNHKQFNGTTIGGLSGIDYDFKRGVYYLISDDRSEYNPARFYTAKVYFTPTSVDSVVFVDVTPLKNKEGQTYPNTHQDPFHTPDPEALRYNPKTDQMTWSSEGERGIKNGKMVLEDPAVTIINKDGSFVDSFTLPSNMHMSAEEKGPRQNSVFEGVSFGDDYKTLYVSVEEPIYEDGPRAGTGDSTAWTRILKFDNSTRQPIAQYAYQLDAIPYPAIPPTAYKINGIPDILYIGNNKMIVLERAYSTGRLACTIKVFLADLSNAKDIGTTGQAIKPAAHPITKKLLFNFESLNQYIDNVEGVTFGPTLPNGHRTLVFVVDDNFSKVEQMQFFVFEVIP